MSAHGRRRTEMLDRVLAGRYHLTEVLGRGGAGTVYRAIDLRTGGPVAVKILHSALAGDLDYTARLRREAAIAASLTSPRIVRVTDLDEHAGAPFLVMEYVAGQTLQEYLVERGRLPIDEALTVALEVSRALMAAHERGIVHRDLKPNNIKLVDGQVKVLDFGVARTEGAPGITRTGIYQGTPDYRAPEQAEGRDDNRSDLYALGVILYELVAGRRPFRGRTALAQHAKARLPPLGADVPRSVQNVITRCLAKIPGMRYQTAAELSRALEAARGGRGAVSEAAAEGRLPRLSNDTLDLPRPRELPTGTVTFLFTDIEGSTRAWLHNAQAMSEALARHDALIEHLVAAHGGQVVRPRGEGDSRFAVFSRASDGAAGACAIQLRLALESWPLPALLRVRMALHTGEAELRLHDYYGPAVNHCARLRSVAHGGQILLSGLTADLVREALSPPATLRDLGMHQLKDLDQPEHVWQLVHPDLRADFPPLQSGSPITP